MVTELNCDSLRAHRWKTGQHSEVTDKNQDVSGVTLGPVKHVVSQVVVHVGYQLVVVGVVASCEERGLTVISACLISYVPGWSAPTACVHSQGVALPNRLTHAAGPFVTGRPCARSSTVWTHSVFHRSAGRDVEKHASLYTCGFLSIPRREMELVSLSLSLSL